MPDVRPFLVHGVLMLAAWMIFLPSGVIVARYFKVLPGQDFPRSLDNPWWFYLHLGLQYAGMALACAGVAIVWNVLGRLDFTDGHARLGLIVMLLGCLQVVAGWLRGTKGGPTDKGSDLRRPETWRGDHYDMTRRRRIFERWHKTAGYVALALAVPTAMMGLHRIGAPPAAEFLPLALAGAFVCIAVALERSGWWVPTYHAIWGPDQVHPGNRHDGAYLSERVASWSATRLDGAPGSPAHQKRPYRKG